MRLSYVLQRLRWAVLTVLGVQALVFALLFLSGDPVALYAPMDATAEQLEEMRRSLGFDRPLHVQFADYIWSALQGDFGTSLRHRQPAMSLVLERFPATLWLAVLALFFIIAFAVPAGILSAARRNSWLDMVTMAVAMVGQSAPVFWIAIILMLTFAIRFKWFPTFGGGTVNHMILPALTLGIAGAGLVARLVRSNMLEILESNYIRTARAKGVAERVVLYRHGFRNAAIPVLTILGLQFGNLLSGAIIVELVFSYPGMGLLAVQAIMNRDIAIVQAFVTVAASLMILINLLVDVSYAFLDPRIAYD